MTKVIINTQYANIHHVASTDETRQVLNGIFVDVSNGKLVATDGRVMTIAPIEEHEGDQSGIIPTHVWKRIIADHKRRKTIRIEFSIDEKQVEWLEGRGELIEGTYPKYEQIIPSETKEKDLAEFGIDPGLLALAAKSLGYKKGNGMTINQLDPSCPMRITCKWAIEAQVILMPMRGKDDNEAERVLNWVRSNLGASVPGTSGNLGDALRKVLRV